MQNPGMLSAIKNLLVPAGSAVRTVQFGLLKGMKMNLDLSRHTQLYLGLYEAEVTPWIQRFSRGIDTFVDVGAADGILTLYALARTDARQVLAFEPRSKARATLLNNMRLNGLSEAPLRLSDKMIGVNDSATETHLDALLSHIGQPCLVKIDVEGAEAHVLEGAPKLLQTPRVRWIIETHAKTLEQTCRSMLRRAGLHTEVVDNAWWRTLLPEKRPIPHNRWIVAYHANDPVTSLS